MEHVEVLERLRERCAALDAAIAALSAQQSGDWVLVRRSAIESAIETLENDGDEHGEGRNLRAAIDEAAAPQPPAEAQAQARAERLAEALRLIESAKGRGFGIDYARGVAHSALRDHDQEVGE